MFGSSSAHQSTSSSTSGVVVVVVVIVVVSAVCLFGSSWAHQSTAADQDEETLYCRQIARPWLAPGQRSFSLSFSLKLVIILSLLAGECTHGRTDGRIRADVIIIIIIIIISGDARETLYLFQRVSLAVQRYNSVAFKDTLQFLLNWTTATPANLVLTSCLLPSWIKFLKPLLFHDCVMLCLSGLDSLQLIS